MFDVPCAICKEMITSESQEKQMGPEAGIISTAVMVDERRFSFGLSGVYLLKGITLKAGDEICYNCMKAQKIEVDLSIKCELCGKAHQPCMEGEDGPHKSAWGCSASVHQSDEFKKEFEKLKVKEGINDTLGDEIGCGFGSKHDMSIYSLDKALKVGTNICDECLDAMVKDGRATLTGSYFDQPLLRQTEDGETVPVVSHPHKRKD